MCVCVCVSLSEEAGGNSGDRRACWPGRGSGGSGGSGGVLTV